MSPEPDPLAAQVAGARRLLAGAPRVTVLTGAGVSTDSGIPDFRGPNGVWTTNPKAERTSNIEYYVRDPEVRRLAWQGRLDWLARPRLPNEGHRALVELERRGMLHTLVTQNIDGLHQAAGTDPALVVEVHGTIHEVVCLGCGRRSPSGDTLDRAFEAASSCDVLLAIGSTLSVYPVAAMVPTARQAGASVVIVNAEPTEMDDLADVVVRGSISEVLPTIVGG